MHPPRLSAWLAVLSLLAAVTITSHAQSLTFTGRHATTGVGIIIDSIRLINGARGFAVTVAGTSAVDLGKLLHASSPPSSGGFRVHDAYPNSFRDRTRFSISTPDARPVIAELFTVAGVPLLQWTGDLSPGLHAFELEAAALSAGIYFLRIRTGTDSRSQALVKSGTSIGGKPAIRLTGTAAMSPAPGSSTAAADRWTFIGYALRFEEDTVADITPQEGQSISFLFRPLAGPGMIRTGPRADLVQRSLTSAGGIVTVTKPGHPLDGMRIEVPTGSYRQTRDFRISAEEILNHGFAPGVIPLTPLITIENGGGYADSVMVLKFPIRLPADHFAMAFFYDETKGTLEGMPILGLTENAVYAATAHFSADALQMGKRAAGTSVRNWVKALVLAARRDDLMGLCDSGFRPGTDDWEFPNYGSYLQPDGHCEGQSMAALWYYRTKSVTDPSMRLFNRYDTFHAKEIWMDNPRGYRFSSVVHMDMDYAKRDQWKNMHFLPEGTPVMTIGTLNYLAFAFSIRNTGYPQHISIWHNNGAAWEGHAMVVYATDNGIIKIADPNFPGQERSTKFQSGAILPYSSGPSAYEPGVSYELIRYSAVTALVDFSRMNQRWSEFLGGTIGTVPPNAFPAVKLSMKTPAGWQEIGGLLTVNSPVVTLGAGCPESPFGALNGWIPFTVVDDQGSIVGFSDASGECSVTVPGGKGSFGIACFAQLREIQGVMYQVEYLDYLPLTIEVKPFVSGAVNCSSIMLDVVATDKTDPQNPIITTRTEYLDGSGVWASSLKRKGGTNSYTFDTSYVAAGCSVTQHATITLDATCSSVKTFSIRWNRNQPGGWSDQSLLEGRDIPVDSSSIGSSTVYFKIAGPEAASRITNVTYSYASADGTFTKEMKIPGIGFVLVDPKDIRITLQTE